MLAIVPPEAAPRSWNPASTDGAPRPVRAVSSRCRSHTPRSDGTESKPQQWRMRAPVAMARSWCASIDARTNGTSPVRSQYAVPASAHPATRAAP